MIPKEVREILEEMKKERIRGASYLAELGAKAFIELSKLGGDPEELAKEIISVKPTMGSLHNLCSYVLKGKNFGRRAEEFLRTMREARERASDLGAKKIEEGAVVITHSYSSAVLSSLLKAKKKGKNFKVIISESQPDLEGLEMAKMLRKEGIEFEVITEAQFLIYAKEADLGMIGADCITSEGYAFNKAGSSFLAFSCYYWGRPLYVVAESYKINLKASSWKDIELSFSNFVRKLNSEEFEVKNCLFDFVPPSMISSFLTDLGEVPPKNLKIVLGF